MVYLITLYNTALAMSNFTNATFSIALRGMWIEFVVIFLCACFLSGCVTRHFVLRIVTPQDQPIAIILAIQMFTASLR